MSTLAPPPAPPLPAAPVMLVEDDPDIRAMVSQLLELEGFTVKACEDGHEALSVLRAGERPFLILLDLMMPKMNGWQFRAEQMRDAALAAIPVVVLSGDVRGQDPGSVRADGYLKKPIDLDVLLEAVRRWGAKRA
ncbi:MAG TPA: response regulator [Myxococcales bacterium]